MQLKLLQLPVPPPTALAATGNVPLAAGTLAVATEIHGLHEQGLDVEVVSPELTDQLGDSLLADHAARDEPEFVGMSLYLWNVERSLHIAREIKRRSPKTKILVGGPEVTTGQGFILESDGFDIAVTGEAEDRFAHLMQTLMQGGDPSQIAGVAMRQANGELGSFGKEPVPAFALTDYPSPYITGALDVDPKRATYVETVRGCASKCTYCFYPRSSGTLRTLDVDPSETLLRAFHERGAREVVFLDPTFNHRPGFTEFLAAIQRANPDRQMSFFGEVRPEGLTPEIAHNLAKAGFTKLEIGMQSVNMETLKRVQRYGDPKRVAEVAKLLQSEGVDLLIDLIIGLPGDTADDVARGIDFMIDNGLTQYAQVFPLSLLPGTAMRASADIYGLEYDRAPPYRIQSTPQFTNDALTQALFDAEDVLDRRLDETPRLHLIEADGSTPQDVFVIDLTKPEIPDRPGARHIALWFEGDDLYSHYDVMQSAIATRLALDPHGVIDVVLRPGSAFPLDLVDRLRTQLDAAAASYQSRALEHRGENQQRRIGVVLNQDGDYPDSWVDALLDRLPVYRDQSLARALDHADDLGDCEPGARIIDVELPGSVWAQLASVPDPDAIVFAKRAHECAWQEQQIDL